MPGFTESLLGDNITLFFDLAFVLFFLLLYLNFRDFRKGLGKIRKRTWSVLILITCTFIFFSLLYNLEFNGTSSSWSKVYTAKEFSEGNSSYYFQDAIREPVYPYLLSKLFSAGLGINGANAFSILIGILSIPVIFLLTYTLFENEELSLLTALLSILTVNIYYTSVMKGPYNLGFLFFSFTILVFLVALKRDKTVTYSLLFLSLSILSQIRMEYIVLFLPFGVVSIVGNKWDRKVLKSRAKKMIIPLLIFAVFTMPLYEKMINKAAWEGEERAILTELSKITNTSASELFLSKDGILPAFSPGYFQTNVIIFFYYAFLISPLYIPLFIIGLYAGLRKYKNQTILIFSLFLILNLLYFFRFSEYGARFLELSYPPFLIIYSLGAFVVIEALGKRLPKVPKKLIFMAVILAVLAPTFFLLEANKEGLRENLNTGYIGEMDSIIENKSIIVMPYDMSKGKWKMLTYHEPVSFYEIKKPSLMLSSIYTKNIPYDRSYITEIEIPFEEGRKTYLLCSRLLGCGMEPDKVPTVLERENAFIYRLVVDNFDTTVIWEKEEHELLLIGR